MRNRRREDTQAEIWAYRHRTSCQRESVFPFARFVLLLAVIGFLLGSWTALQAAPFDDEPQPPRPPLETLSDLPYLPSDNLKLDTREPLEPYQFVAWSRLVFQSMRDNNWEIYSAAGDGSGQTRLTNHPAEDIQPRFDRGANRIVFASKRGGNDYEIYSMDANGLDVVQLTNNSADDLAPDWSPNGARIVFQSHLDGQAEVYVMNANGSNPVRLTSHPGYDGGPVWSPDSSQIAFTSNRDGQNRVWLMRADGSNPTVLAYLPRSQNPAWSPDGSQIALDCDENGDTWQELCLVKLDGTFQHEVYKAPTAQTDVRARSWSPDGRFVAFTEITYANQAGQWHWTNANLYAWDSINPLSVRRLSSNLDWEPGWQTTDVEVPTAALSNLPAQSPSPIVVQWSGTDSGLAGIRNYDVQARDGEAGAWLDWLSATTAITGTYPGVGGHTYGFRVRARDNAFNAQPWPAGPQQSTTVEALPPVTAVQPLPHYLRNYWGSVSWGGYDLGGSGIKEYDLQYHRQGDDWTTWLTTPITSSTFLGEAGKTYYFRSTGRDHALNVEAVHPGPGDASTTLYNWAVTGRSFDFRGMPVLGVTAVVTPSAFATLPSTLTAGYASYVADWPETYEVHWPVPGYGDLPPTRFDRSQDALLDVYLPPPGNLVQDWGFERGALEPAWQPSGAFTPTVSSTFRHTGISGALLGCLPFTRVRSQLASSGAPQSSKAVLDSSGVIHAVWTQATSAGRSGVYYARRIPNEPWSAPHNLSDSLGYAGGPQLAVGSDGTVHVILSGDSPGSIGLYYAQRAPSGVWSTPQLVATGQSPQIAVDGRGIVHLLWWETLTGLRYAQRTLSGSWTLPQTVAREAWQFWLAVTTDGRVHVVWV